MSARTPRHIRRLILAVSITVAALGAAPGAAAQIGSSTTDTPETTTAATPAPSSDEPGRLDVVADALRRDPLYVDDELSWMLDAEQTRELRRDLRDARVPVLVAFLPSLAQDESGGDTRRVLRGLQERVDRDAVYVVVDDDGRFDLASYRVPLDLSISFSLLSPPRDERPYAEQDANPGPAGYTTVPDRLREIVEHVRVAGAGTPNGLVDRIRPLRTLPGHHGPANSAQDIVAAGIFGLFVGLVASGSFMAFRRATRRERSASSSRKNRRKGGRRA